MIDKIRERLRKWDKYSQDGLISIMGVMNIINQVEAEYNNGWIPCSERLPEGEDYVLAQYADGKYIGGDDIWMAFYNHTEEHWEYETDEGLLITPKVIAWQPLPEPYKKGE